jgi:ATP-dependent exoDNAse (exonuclease V) beta subunit
MNTVLTHFNIQQKEALDTTVSVLVEAGAGAGKTAVLVQRYLRLLEKGILIQNIVAITFTRKAAFEMKSRVHETLLQYKEAHPDWAWVFITLSHFHTANITTIHGYCNTVLSDFFMEAELPAQPRLLEDADKRLLWDKAVEAALKHCEHIQHPSLAFYLTFFSWNQLVRDLGDCFAKYEQLLQLDANFLHPDTTDISGKITQTLVTLFKKTVDVYTALKKEQEAIDYSDLIYLTHRLLTGNTKVCETISSKIEAVLVDEFQDTDSLQWEILKKICGYEDSSPISSKNLFFVGDPKQSIYGFRGTHTQLFADIKTQWRIRPDTKVVELSDNYRTLPALLDVFNPFFSQVLADDPLGFFPLTPYRKEAPSLVGIGYLEEESKKFEDEIPLIAEWILQVKNTMPHLEWCDIAVLFRRKKHMIQLQQGLKQSGIFAQIEPQQSPLFQSYWDLFNLCRCLLDSSFEEAWSGFSSSNYAVGISAEVLNPWLKQAQKEARIKPLSWVLEDSLRNLGIIMSPWEKAFVQHVAELEIRVGYSGHDFINLLFHHMQDLTGPVLQTPQKSIRMMTIHASKGLEFKAVIIPECSRKWTFSQSDRVVITPHGTGLSYKIQDKQQNLGREKILEAHKKDVIAEEKRLFYVACTRACDHLFFSGVPVRPLKEDAQPQSYADLIHRYGAGCFNDMIRPL